MSQSWHNLDLNTMVVSYIEHSVLSWWLTALKAFASSSVGVLPKG